MKRWATLAWLVTVTLLVAGCSGPPASDTSSEYVEPAWMAEQRAIGEQYDAEIMNCLAAQGVTGTVGKNGGVSIIIETPNGEEIPDEVSQRHEEVSTHCAEQVPTPASWTKAIDEESYQQIVDVTECIKAQGVAVESPPSLSSWLETARNNPEKIWAPFLWLAENQTIGYQALEDLMSSCQQQPFAGLDIGAQR